MAQQYYEYVNYKEEHVLEQKKLPKGACHSYIIVFQSIFHIIFNVSLQPSFALAVQLQEQMSRSPFVLSLPSSSAEFCLRGVPHGFHPQRLPA